jgi:hypothetical protein
MKKLIILFVALFAAITTQAQYEISNFELEHTVFVMHRDSTDFTASQKERIKAMHLSICEPAYIAVYSDSAHMEQRSRNAMTAVGLPQVTQVYSNERKVSIIWFKHTAKLED